MPSSESWSPSEDPGAHRAVPARPVDWRVILASGLLLAVVAGLAGGALEYWRFGPHATASVARIEAEVQASFVRMMRGLQEVASAVADDRAAAPALASTLDAERPLFEILERQTKSSELAGDRLSVTVYDARGVARAWMGRPSDIATDAAAEFFVTPSPLGLRLVHVAPIRWPDGTRIGTVVAEHVLSQASAAARLSEPDWKIATSLAPASLHMRYEADDDQPRPNTFVVRAGSGTPLVEVSVQPSDLAHARAEWRRRTGAVVLALLAATVLLLIGPILDRRARARDSRRVVRTTVIAFVLLAVGAAFLWAALMLVFRGHPGTGALLLLGGVTAACAVALAGDPISQLPLALRARRSPAVLTSPAFLARQLAAGALMTAILAGFLVLLARAVDPSIVDLREFSLHPWNPVRLVLLGGILACQIATIWAGVLVLTASLARWRFQSRTVVARLPVALLWMLPAGVLAALVPARGWPVPVFALLLSAAACVVAALLARRLVAAYRHATVAARILALLLAFLGPALLLYPAVNHVAEAAVRDLITDRYAVEAQHHVETLQEKTTEAQAEIDALASLPQLLVSGGPTPPTPRTGPAFLVWSQTALARARLTSAIELYDRSGALVSRFALNFPEYTGTTQAPEASAAGSGCDWDTFGEVAPFGSEERRMLHAQRQICVTDPETGRQAAVGTIVIHVAFDYQTLPFITSQSPYFQALRSAGDTTPREGAPGSDVDVVIYGWGLGPIYSSRRVAWPITDDIFRRLYVPTRDPFWASIDRGDDDYKVYFTNDRLFIYAVGFPALSPFDHLVHLAELTTFSAAAYVLALLVTAGFTRIARERARVGRALLREIRASFYRKLFLAFVFAAVVPVLTLALVIRAYVATQLRADVEAEATRTTAVAQRVIDQSDALQRRASDGVQPVSDDVMVWISQIIDQDVNIFEGAQLVATSERDLFESGLLPTRTPSEVYRGIVLNRLPSFVGEDQIGTVPYIVAAAPVRAGGRDAILTVPLANRQRDIEREIEDLDRGVHLAALFFVLLGAGIGLWMAERIADPVRRLTRATRRIARGDFDAQIAVRSADELRRLVDAFNRMAAELKGQRAQLERTHRLEAWAEMARQVAHEIKNPLTPIQLSAEHLRRVHADRGQPLGPVLEGCVDSILGQVRLLRQISAEFSNFASSPTARPAEVDVPELVAEVIEPYRTGLAGRVDIVNEIVAPLPKVFVDRTLVARALGNIIENALHAMPAEGRLTIAGGTERTHVTVTVTDTGAGMDEEALARVFEPYFSTKTTGTGLGLPIARRNIELNGGSVDVQSARGQGTTVRVRLPVAEG